jgi:hypothetical protein
VSSHEGENNCTDLTSNVSVNPGISSASQVQEEAEENSEQNGVDTDANGAETCATSHVYVPGTETDADPPGITRTSDASGSASGSLLNPSRSRADSPGADTSHTRTGARRGSTAAPHAPSRGRTGTESPRATRSKSLSSAHPRDPQSVSSTMESASRLDSSAESASGSSAGSAPR